MRRRASSLGADALQTLAKRWPHVRWRDIVRGKHWVVVILWTPRGKR